MHGKVMRGLMLALVAMVVVSTMAVAADKQTVSQTLTGTVTNVDMKKTTLSLKVADGKTRQLKVTKNLLEGLKAGDHVKVMMVGKKVQSINKDMEKPG